MFSIFLYVDYVDYISNFCYNNKDKDKSIKLGTETSQVWTQKVRWKLGRVSERSFKTFKDCLDLSPIIFTSFASKIKEPYPTSAN